MYLDFINEANIKTTSEILRSFEWDFAVTTIPSAVYYPGSDVLRLRAKTATVPTDPSITNGQAQMRGYVIYQPGLSTNQGDFGLTLQDFEDQSITAFILDWIYKSSHPLTRMSLRKADLKADFVLYRLNINRQAVAAWNCFTCFITSSGMGDQWTNNTADPIQEVTFSCNCQLAYRTTLNA